MEEELLIEWLDTYVGEGKWHVGPATRTIAIDEALPTCIVDADEGYVGAMRMLRGLAKQRGFGLTPAPDPDATA